MKTPAPSMNPTFNQNKMDQDNNTALKILYWNTRSFKQRSAEIRRILQDVDILICVETCLSPSVNLRFPGFQCFRKDRNYAKGGGILFLIRNNLAFCELTDIQSPDRSVEICGIKIQNITPQLDLIACYRSPGLALSQDQWHTIIRNVNNNNNSLLVGDFNAHHAHWSCENTDTNGLRLSEAIDSHNLFLHNENTHTYIDVHRDYKSNLDLVLTSNLASDITTVSVSDETWESDHFPVFINVNAVKHLYTKKTFKIRSTRTD